MKCAEMIHKLRCESEKFACPWNAQAFDRSAAGLLEHEPVQTLRFMKQHVGGDKETYEMKILIKLLKQKLSPRLWECLSSDLRPLFKHYR